MSKFDELIQQHCPDGVEYRTIGDIIKRVRERQKDDPSILQVYVVSNTQGMVNAEEYRDNIIHSEDVSNYTIVRPGMFAYNPSRLNIGSIAMLHKEVPGLVSPMYVVFEVDETQVDGRYFEYFIHSSYVGFKINSFKEEGARFRFDFDRWAWIEIPVPPIPIQQEIVRILDTFTDYSAELAAELAARREQYSHYLNIILSTNNNSIKYKLSDVSNMFRGEYITKKTYPQGEIPVVLGGTEPAYYIDRSNHIGEAISISRSGASAGFVSYWDEPIFLTDCFGFEAKDGFSNKYLYYSLKHIEDRLNRMKRGAGVPHVSGEALLDIELNIPSYNEQLKAVESIEKFERICSDLSFGLPAEIEARQKQYEYYRDKLLTFKRKEA